MTIEDIKAALFDGAIVRVVGDHANTYSTWTSPDGLYMHAYLNDNPCTFRNMFDNIELALCRQGGRVFRRDFTDRTLITIIIGIGEEV